MSTLTHELSLAGGRTFVVERGRGPAIVFAHCLLGDHHIFDPQLDALSESHRVIAPDFRGHGSTAVPRGPWRVEDLAVDLLAVMDALEVRSALVAGLSMGGMVAMRAALRAPERVSALLLMSTMARSVPRKHRLRFRALGVGASLLGVRGWMLDQILPYMFHPSFDDEAPDVVSEMRARVAALPPRGVDYAVRAVAGIDDILGSLASITCPTTVLVGADDRTTPTRESLLIRERIPHAELEILDDTGHLVSLERPDDVSRILTALAMRSAA